MQSSFNKNHWSFDLWPRCWSLVSWQTYPKKILGILNLKIPSILARTPFWCGCNLILRRMLVLHILVPLLWHPLLLQPSFVMQTNPSLRTLQKSQNRLSQCHLGIRLCLSTFDIEVPTPHSWNDRCPSTWQNELFFASSVLLGWRSFCSLLWPFAMLGFFELLPLFVHWCFGIQDVHSLGQKIKIVHKSVMVQRIEPLAGNAIFMIFG